MNKLAVVAFGGNALLRSGQKGTYQEQIANVENTCESLYSLIKQGYNLVIGHGNGPQVGNVMLQHEGGFREYNIPSMPMDFCVAETQGSIAHLIEMGFRNMFAKYEIETQEDMMSRLISEGFKVTQATVSRDLKELKLTKIQTARGTYRYAVGQVRGGVGNVKINNAMADSITEIRYSLNNVVIKTYPAMAQAAASAIDNMNWDEIVGTIAGDDTIFVALKTIEDAEVFCGKVKEILSI